MLDEQALFVIAWKDVTGIRASEGDDLSRSSEVIEAVARASLGLPCFAEVPLDRAGLITLSDSLTSMSLDAIDDLWDEHKVRRRPTGAALVHRFVFYVGLLARPDRTDNVKLAAPSEVTLGWLWRQGVYPKLPGNERKLGEFK